MATRRPLVIVDGLLSDLLEGDSVRTSDQASSVIAGSGLGGGGDASSNISLQVNLAASPSGVIYVGDSIGLDGSDIVQANTALSSGTAAQVLSNTALSSGVAATFTAESALASGNAALAGVIPFQGGDTYTAVYTASSNVSVGDAVGVDDANRVRPIFGAPDPTQRVYNANVASGLYFGQYQIQEPSGSYMQFIDFNNSINAWYATPALINNSKSITLYPAGSINIGANGASYERFFSQAGSSTDTTSFVSFIGDTSTGNLYVSRRSGTSNTSPGSSQIQAGWTIYPTVAPWPNNGVILYYCYQTGGGASRNGYLRMCNIGSGGITSLGNQLSVTPGGLYQPRGIGYDTFASRVILIENYNIANGFLGWYTHSGNTISYSSGWNIFNSLPVQYSSGTPNETNIVFDTNINRNIFFYCSTVSGTVRLCYLVFYWTGSTYAYGTPTVLTSDSTNTAYSSTYDSVNKKIIVKYYEQNTSLTKIAIGSISGTTFNVESTTTVTATQFNSSVEYNAGSDLVLTRNSQYITTGEIVRNITPVFNTKNNFVGISRTAAASGSTVTVSLPGAINYSKTGLTPGTLYYPDILTSGALTTASGQPTSWSSVTPWRAPLQAVTSSGLLILDSL